MTMNKFISVMLHKNMLRTVEQKGNMYTIIQSE